MDKDIKTNKTDNLCQDFQANVSTVLVRHKSILDIMSKMNEYNARIHRAVTKAVTNCGCITINAKEQDFSGESYKDLSDTLENHLHGELCEQCAEIIEIEMGNYLFYITALCDTLGLDLEDVISQEHDRNKALGMFNLR